MPARPCLLVPDDSVRATDPAETEMKNSPADSKRR